MQLINVVNENETKWTYFCLIIDSAPVKRSGVRKGTCSCSKPSGRLLLINSSEDGRFESSGKRVRHEERETQGGGREGCYNDNISL